MHEEGSREIMGECQEIIGSCPNRQGANIGVFESIGFVIRRERVYRGDLGDTAPASGMPHAGGEGSESWRSRYTHSCLLRGPHNQSAGE